ncbi:hypothetical protein [Kitasatospora purpeofusca]|uniref:hypothetical protein n=1 Tax=Kitasatospora purpeofusca TaxID=67352 RepID=UPI003654E46B
MAIITPPAWEQGGTYSARTDRLSVITGLLGYHGSSADEASLRTRGGVRPSYQQQQLAVAAQGTPNMTVSVSAGICYVQNKDLANYGAYTVVNDAAVTLTIAASSGSQFRKDTVVVQVLDAETLGVVNSASLVVVQGPYAASAGATTRGTLPPNSIVLADVAVDAAVTSITNAKISDARQYQVGAGGILPVTSAALPDHPAPGQVMYATDTDTFLYGTTGGGTKALLDSAGAGVGSFRQAMRTVDSSPMTNSTTLTADSQLTIPVVANARYALDAWIVFTSDLGTDIKMDWTTPAGSSGLYAALGTGISNYTDYDSSAVTFSFVRSTRGNGTVAQGISSRGTLTTAATAGSLTLRWAQNTSGATATKLLAGSWIRLQRMA